MGRGGGGAGGGRGRAERKGRELVERRGGGGVRKERWIECGRSRERQRGWKNMFVREMGGGGDSRRGEGQRDRVGGERKREMETDGQTDRQTQTDRDR